MPSTLIQSADPFNLYSIAVVVPVILPSLLASDVGATPSRPVGAAWSRVEDPPPPPPPPVLGGVLGVLVGGVVTSGATICS